MRIAYYDESGDDGYPDSSSKYFVLTALYLHYLNWEDVLRQLVEFRRQIKASYGLPLKLEFHTSAFLKKKKPYTGYGLTSQDRLDIIGDYCDVIASLELKIVNVVIVKDKIEMADYRVLDKALQFSIQRIQNDLRPTENPENKFVIITDDGRHTAMRKTSRRMRRINFVPSRFGGESMRIDISTLIEDPLPKNSAQSYFIQTADLISFVVYLYTCQAQGNPNIVARRIRNFIGPTEIMDWMDRLMPSLNVQASRSDAYGVVFHPQ